MTTRAETDEAPRPTPIRENVSGDDADKGASGKSKRAGGRGKRRFGLYISILVVIAAVAFGIRETQFRMSHVYEQDARIAGDLVTISSRVAGWVTEMSVREGDTVERAAVLLTIDPRNSQLTVARLEAQLDGLAAERKRLQAERELADSQIVSRINTRRSEVAAARAAIASLAAQRQYAKGEFERAKSLYAQKVVSKSKLDQDRTTMDRMEGDYRKAQAELVASEAKLDEAKAESARLGVLDTEIEVLSHKRAEYVAQVEIQKLDVADRTIKSPIGGVIDRTFVEVGEYVSPGQRLALIHNPDTVWVEANIKETEIRRLAVGQRVDLSIDAYPDKTFTGRLERIGTAATSEFALLPSPNPSGNFTKTTQKLRTRISVDEHNGLLRPGMMVEVSINVR
ncbi:MAG: HlyD family secretion protein [Gammaproteobacteria bacterium]|nr:HlyD family secretion protein [Gammaproteobacteria bacterium]